MMILNDGNAAFSLCRSAGNAALKPFPPSFRDDDNNNKKKKNVFKGFKWDQVFAGLKM